MNIENRLNKLEAKAGPSGLFFAGVYLNDPQTFPPGRIGITVMQETPGGAVCTGKGEADTEAAALAWLAGQKVKGTIYIIKNNELQRLIRYPDKGGL
jgi:hypothetical protein